jgi:hypothetical protein
MYIKKLLYVHINLAICTYKIYYIYIQIFLDIDKNLALCANIFIYVYICRQNRKVKIY